MANHHHDTELRVAVLVDCDNSSPEILEYALKVIAQFGRVVMRRGYGNHSTLANKWQEALVKQAFTPCLQYQYASGKNTSDIALALDALEARFDQRVDSFCLVTSDSDFAYLCRKLRERGATVRIVGEAKTPDALRNASDQFFEWTRDKSENESLTAATSNKQETPKQAVPKQQPEFVVEAVAMLTRDTSEGSVDLSALGQYLKRTKPDFAPNKYGHSALKQMVKNYDQLEIKPGESGTWFVQLKG